MRRLLTGYAVSFNHRHDRAGHLFQNRYKSILCQEDSYLLELVRYIHLNPLRAGLVSSIHQLDRYRYCGHSILMGKRNYDWQDTQYVLGLFGKRVSSAGKGYRMTGTVVASRLNMSKSAVSRAVVRGERIVAERKLKLFED